MHGKFHFREVRSVNIFLEIAVKVLSDEIIISSIKKVFVIFYAAVTMDSNLRPCVPFFLNIVPITPFLLNI